MWFGVAANNIDPRRDCFYMDNKDMEQIPTLFLDATRKSKEFDDFERPWPNIVTADEQTIKKVDANWEKMGLGRVFTFPIVKIIESSCIRVEQLQNN